MPNGAGAGGTGSAASGQQQRRAPVPGELNQGPSRAADDYLQATVTPPLTKYELKAGDPIQIRFSQGVTSAAPGQFRAVVSQPVFDHATGLHILIPRRHGARRGMAAAGAAVIDLPAPYAEYAPQVHPWTMDAVVQVESDGRVLALKVNRFRPQPPQPTTADAAVQTAEAWIARGYSADIGLGQINSRNLAALGLTVHAALDPCANLRGAAAILAANYASAVQWVGEGQLALGMALSAYNTGSYDRGFNNGYVVSNGFESWL